jgi:outer membrane murein-binding lipoprotein Lpp
MPTTTERLGVVETKVENLNGKIDELKVDVKEMHDCLDKTRDDLKNDLEKMYGASCSQHAALAKDISDLKELKDRWTWMAAGGLAAAGWIAGFSEKIFTIFT